MIGWLLLAGLAVAEPDPSDATVVYYNARMALREGHASEAVGLWLLRNALEDRTGRVSPFDGDFRSVTWAALGELGLCQDGYPHDRDGVGLWPLALHNPVVRTLGRTRPPRLPRPFAAFDVGRQQRLVAITDVLDAQELATVKLARTRCLGPALTVLVSGEPLGARLSDPEVAARLLRRLLEQARTTLARDRVRGMAAIEARLFDLDLQLTQLAARQARDERRVAVRRAREAGLSYLSINAMEAEAPVSTLAPSSRAAEILRACASWPASEWMSLSPDRRLFLYTHARAYDAEPERFDSLGLAIVDALIAEGDGVGVTEWIGQLTEGGATPEAVWGGSRGQALLSLDAASGFRERAVIALYRGVDQLQRGQLPDALRSLAFAREQAAVSSTAGALEGLSLRWLSYVAGQFAITAELLVTLQELVPRRDYAVILEDLLWSAAFHADGRSFTTGVENQVGRGALERRLALLAPLAAGDGKRFAAGVARGLTESPSETLRFLDQLVQRLELEDAGVRAAQIPTLVSLRRLLAPLAAGADDGDRQARTADALMARIQAIADGLGGLPETTARDRARVLAPDGEVYAGSIRLAPADALPWPFRPSVPSAPSVFAPLELRPVEWRDPSGALVFGWSIRG